MNALAADNVITIRIHKEYLDLPKCENCHFKKKNEFIYPKKKLIREHTEKKFKHGRTEISCGSCHDANHSNYLRTSKEAAATFANSSPVCMQCHVDIFRDWSKGIHGKRVGGWDRDKVQSQCIDCHNSHSVTFKQMKAEPMPHKPKFQVDKVAE